MSRRRFILGFGLPVAVGWIDSRIICCARSMEVRLFYGMGSVINETTKLENARNSDPNVRWTCSSFPRTCLCQRHRLMDYWSGNRTGDLVFEEEDERPCSLSFWQQPLVLVHGLSEYCSIPLHKPAHNLLVVSINIFPNRMQAFDDDAWLSNQGCCGRQSWRSSLCSTRSGHCSYAAACSEVIIVEREVVSRRRFWSDSWTGLKGKA